MDDDSPPVGDPAVDEPNKAGSASDATTDSGFPSPGRSSRLTRAIGDESNATKSGSGKYHSSWYRRGTVRQEARATLEGQVDHCNEIDAKAMRTFRFSLVLLGLLTPALTLAVRYGPIDGIAAFYSPDVIAGMVCLVSSAALAGVTYTTSTVAIGLSSGAIRDARRRNLTDRATHDALLDSYARWIRTNDRTILRNSLLVTATVLLLIYAVVFLALGVTSAVVGQLPQPVRWFAYAALAVLTVLSRLL